MQPEVVINDTAVMLAVWALRVCGVHRGDRLVKHVGRSRDKWTNIDREIYE